MNRLHRRNAAIALLIVLATISACYPPSPTTKLDITLRAIIEQEGLTGDPSRGRDIPDVEDPLAQLGMKLFFSKALSGDKDAACVTCHHPLLGGGDAMRLPVGVGADDPDHLGPGRTHPSGYATVPRNAPTTFNIALWDQALFHDGRIESLGKSAGRNGADGQGLRTPDTPFGSADPAGGDDLVMAQSRFPVTSQAEMRGFLFEVEQDNAAVRRHLAARLGDYEAGQGELTPNAWLAEFQAALASDQGAEALISEDNIFRAIGVYERSQVFVDTPWKAYVEGDSGAIGEAAKQGALLFFRTAAAGGANCAGCHSGDFFTDEQFHVLAVPQIGPGKGDGQTGDDDFGRFRETGAAADRYAFRTPTLLNLAVTAPYGHDGAYATLADMVRHHLNPAAAVDAYNYALVSTDIHIDNARANTQSALAKLQADRQAGLPCIEDVDLSEDQIDDLVSFLLTLTDPCVQDAACLAPWISDESDSDPDGLQLRLAQTP